MTGSRLNKSCPALSLSQLVDERSYDLYMNVHFSKVYTLRESLSSVMPLCSSFGLKNPN